MKNDFTEKIAYNLKSCFEKVIFCNQAKSFFVEIQNLLKLEVRRQQKVKVYQE